MQLRTYTGLWRWERRIWRVYDINLPFPVSVRQILTFMGTFTVWIFVMNIVGIPFAPPWHVVWLAPPAALTYLANRPIAEGKTLTEWLGSQLRYLVQAKQFTRLGARNQPEVITIAHRFTVVPPAPTPSPR
jgi:hypothetical protein